MRYSRRSVPWRGRELQERDLQWKSCCLAVRIQGIDSTSCYRKRICGLHLLPEHSHRRIYCADIQQREAPAAGRTPWMNINLK